MPRSSILLTFLLLLLPLNPLPAPGALERTQVSDKVYPALKTAEACDRAERERLPVCFCYLGQFPPDAEMPADLDRVWRDSTDLLAKECIVVMGRHGDPGWGDFSQLRLRRAATSLRYGYGGVTLVDSWQEERLGEARFRPTDPGDPRNLKGMLPVFSKEVAGLLKTAAAWKKLKPESWQDTKGRAITATAVSWDGKTAVLRLATGKTVSLPAATLSAESAARLSKLFRLQVPFVDAMDAAALESHRGRQVCVVGREEKVTPVSSVDTSGDVKTYYLYFSPHFRMKYGESLYNELEANNPGSFTFGRGRVYGLLEKGKTFGGKEIYFIRLTDTRDFGPGMVLP
ncbi:MAG: hypothetical protein EOP86_24245 [Verrucomicrobiaceae bacterium]|nr:MAG: hypothetical protein EOP86_24245 [Verrucomicrobiaceae bacterium]